MKQIDNRQKQVIQSRAQRALTGFKNFFKKKEHAHIPLDKHEAEPSEEEKAADVPAPAINEYHPGPKFGRNDPCPCGSGKKYKKCCIGKAEITPFSGGRDASAGSPPKAKTKVAPPSQKKAAHTTPRKKPRPK